MRFYPTGPAPLISPIPTTTAREQPLKTLKNKIIQAMAQNEQTTKMVTGGVVMDNFKKDTYTREIEKAGFEISETTPMGADTVLIKVTMPAHRVLEFGKLLQRLEFKYSIRNRHN